MCSLKAATRNSRALQPREGQREIPALPPRGRAAARAHRLPSLHRAPETGRNAFQPFAKKLSLKRIKTPTLSLHESGANEQSGEERQLQSDGGTAHPERHCPEAGTGAGGADPTVSRGPRQQHQRSPAPGASLFASATASPHSHGHIPSSAGPAGPAGLEGFWHQPQPVSRVWV